MKFDVRTEDFKTTLSALAKVVKPNKAIPILGYVHVKSDERGLAVSGTDHKTFYRILVEAEHEDVDLMLNLTETHKLLSKLDPDDRVSFSQNADGLTTVRSGNTTWRHESRTGVDFPTFPDLDESMYQEIDTTLLGSALTAAMRATPQKVTFNPGLTQVWVHDGVIDSGDGMVYQRVVFPELPHVDVTIPNQGVKTLLAVLRGWEGNVKFGHTDTHVVVRTDTQVLGIGRYTHEFPDISPFLDDPKISHTDKIAFVVKELMAALSRVSLCAPPNGVVRVDVDETMMKLTSKTPEGSMEAYCTCTWDGGKQTLWVDWKALSGALAAIGGEDTKIALGPSTMRNPTTLYLTSERVQVVLVQMRGRA